MSSIAIVICVFFVLMFLGLPISFSLGISSVAYCFVSGQLMYLYMIPEKIFTGMNNFVLLAIPLFMLTGEIMNRGGITEVIVDFCNEAVGRLRGGLGYVNIVASTLFAGITGSALSDVAALGSMLIPAMEKSGYDREYSTAVTAASAIQGPIIPPSIPAVLIASVTGVSTGALFLGGAVPGVLLGIFCCIVTFFLAKKRNYPKLETKFNFINFLKLTIRSFFPIMTPVVVLGGLLTGIFTPTEAAAVSVLYAFLVTILGFKKISLKEFTEILRDTAMASTKVYYIIGTATVFAWVLAIENIPTKIAGFITSIAVTPMSALLFINIFLLFWGMWMDTAPSIMILMPLLFPIAEKVGINPIHFGVVVVINLMIGLLTPPFGMALFSAQTIGRVPLKSLLKELVPFLVADFILLALISIFPEIILFLPRMFGLV
jgi:tripartite ATP-independent transporter DctM subunit